MFSVRLSQLSAADVQNILDIEAAEDLELELKKALSALSGVDPWMNGGKIGDRAKDELADEMIAFANTSGGTLILGIDEDPQTKAAKKPLYPIPRCKEAAAILHQSLSARIEPRLPHLECEGVVTEQDGSSGVVVMRVLESYLAPHRNTQNNRCFVRRNDRAEPMSMLEIQELTRRVARSGETIGKAFSDSAEQFFNWIPGQFQRTHPERGLQGSLAQAKDGLRYSSAWAVRLTAVPTRSLSLGRLPNQPWLELLKAEVFAGTGRQGVLRSYDLEVIRAWSPRLRAVERELKGTWLFATDRITSDGQVERFTRHIDTVEGGRPSNMHLGVGQYMWHVASIIQIVDVIRAQADRPTQDYAFEIELMTSDTMHLDGYPGGVPPGLQKLPASRTVFPRYAIGDREAFNELLTVVDYDLWSAAGNHMDWELAVNWPTVR